MVSFEMFNSETIMNTLKSFVKIKDIFLFDDEVHNQERKEKKQIQYVYSFFTKKRRTKRPLATNEMFQFKLSTYSANDE